MTANDETRIVYLEDEEGDGSEECRGRHTDDSNTPQRRHKILLQRRVVRQIRHPYPLTPTSQIKNATRNDDVMTPSATFELAVMK